MSARPERFYAFRLPDGTYDWAYHHPADGPPLKAVAWFTSLKLVREYVTTQDAIVRTHRERDAAQQELTA